jgi:anti-sigma B factor antagonist
VDLTVEIAEKRIDDVLVETVTGESDVATAPELRERLLTQEADGVLPIVVDLTGVSFIDSTDLGRLVRAYRRQQDADGCLPPAVGEPRILNVPETKDLSKVFPGFATVGEAVQG